MADQTRKVRMTNGELKTVTIRPVDREQLLAGLRRTPAAATEKASAGKEKPAK